MRNEIELLVAGLNGEVISVGGLISASCSKRGICKNDVIALSAIRFVDRISQIDVRLDAM